MAEQDEGKRDVLESARASSSDSSPDSLSPDSQEKAEKQKEREKEQDAKRREGHTPSSQSLPKVKLFSDQMGNTVAQAGDLVVNALVSNKEYLPDLDSLVSTMEKAARQADNPVLNAMKLPSADGDVAGKDKKNEAPPAQAGILFRVIMTARRSKRTMRTGPQTG